MLCNLGFLDPLHTIGAFLHHSAHPHSDIRIPLQFNDIRRALIGQRPEIFMISSELSYDPLFPDRPLIVIEEIKPAYLERAVVSAIPGPYATVVNHDVE